MENDKQSYGAKLKALLLGDASRSPEERKLVRKLDFFIMTFCCFAYFFNFLDRAAFANAYVSGLREAINMTPEDYSKVLAVTTAGLATGQLPNGIIIQKVSPRIWYPSMIVIWAGLTMASAAVKNTAQICAIRFLLGLAEASTYGGAMYLMGAWYRPSEISIRIAAFSVCGNIGTMFAGVMMTAIHKGMRGMGGLDGWQWVFLIDGIMTLPIAVFGYFFIPGTPDRPTARFLTKEQLDLSLARVQKVSEEGHSVSPMSLVKRVVMQPLFWLLFFWSPICAATEGFPFQGNFILWLKYHSDTFSLEQINLYPLGVQAVAVATNIFVGWQMDLTGKRVPMTLVIILLQVVVGVMLLIRSLPFAGTFVAFYMSGTAYAVNPLIWSWANIILMRTGDDALRSITLFSMNIGSMVLWTFWGILFYNAADAPYWRNGAIVLLVACFVMACYTVVMVKIDRYTLKKYGDGQSVNSADAMLSDEKLEKDDGEVTVAPVSAEKTVS